MLLVGLGSVLLGLAPVAHGLSAQPDISMVTCDAFQATVEYVPS